jgi:glycosyltransferase involved in cell wall biosynthesis
MTPAVSVVMPIHNGERFLREAVDSLQRQTLDSWELIAVLDRCADATRSILESFSDSRIRLLDGPQPGGLVRSLNFGLAQCRAPLVARLDADDVCEPERLAMQKQVLDARAALLVVGSGAILIDADSRVVGSRAVVCGAERLRRRLLWKNALVHSSVMFQREPVLALGGYAEYVSRAGDYYLWLRIAAVGDIDNLPVPLVRYRVHSGQISRGRYHPPFRWLLKARMTLAERCGVSTAGTLFRHTAWMLRQYSRW